MSTFQEKEEKIIEFWKTHKIFKRSVSEKLPKNKKTKGETFSFLEGPPTANNVPHIGHFLTRVCKDTILRFQTMRGKYVPRSAGWDTHGLPVEVEVEKKIGIKNKRDIEKYGVDKFTKACKESVWQYKGEWEKIDDRSAFWIDQRHPYITYDPNFMESVWNILKQVHEKKLLVEEFRSQPYCTRCGTALSQAEVGQTDAYQNIQDASLYVKFKITQSPKLPELKGAYLLAWTTTPWTLLGNAALAVHPKLSYSLFDVEGKKVIAYKLPEGYSAQAIKKFLGGDLVGITYEPLYPSKAAKGNDNAHKVYGADFVGSDDGTGIVHIAPAYGEDDFQLGKKEGLPVINFVNEGGLFDSAVETLPLPEIEGIYIRKAHDLIVEDLKQAGLVLSYDPKGHTHAYPHCWRCKSPLIYFAMPSWVIKMSKIKDKIIANNKKVNWVPKTAGHRFYEWIKEGKDWNISRKRFWGTPLPIWRCGECKKIEVIGSFKQLASHTKIHNTYYIMRHGEAIANVKHTASSQPEPFFNLLTKKGIAQVHKTISQIKKLGINLIIASPVLRTKDTAQLVAEKLGIPIAFDERLQEVNFGQFNGKKISEYQAYFETEEDQYYVSPQKGETFTQMSLRTVKALQDLEKKHTGKKILIVSHQGPLMVLAGAMQGLTPKQTVLKKDLALHFAEVKKMIVYNLPRNEEGEVDIHKPFIDDVAWKCSCGGTYNRVPEVCDVWLDSGSALFSSKHYPFEEKNIKPADFVCEAIDQTRGWFYTLLAVATLVKDMPAYKNILVLGHVQDAQGKKMSKSLGNVVSPKDVMHEYVADPFRFYLFYVSEPGEPKKFNPKELETLKRNYFDLLQNIFNFYKMYSEKAKNAYKGKIVKSPLDTWFDIRMKQARVESAQYLEALNPHKAARTLYDVVQDFSLWWLRRSRQRFQNPISKADKYSGLLLFEQYLLEIAKISAPLIPFFSEMIYQELRQEPTLMKKTKLSVHLEILKKDAALTQSEKKALTNMQEVRGIVSEALRIRKDAGVKVRTPLGALYINKNIEKSLLSLICDEVNVKQIILKSPQKITEHMQKGTVGKIALVLDCEITPDLKEEGLINDFLRMVQKLRQDANLMPSQKVVLYIAGQKPLEQTLSAHEKQIVKDANLAKIVFGEFKVRSEKVGGETLLAENDTTFEDFGNVRLTLVKK